MTAVADLTERELIARIERRLPPRPDWLLVGIGDDAAVVEPERNRVEVLSVDAIVEGVHFDRAFVPPDAIGHRALAVNLSDLAAMGAAPRVALVSLALPSSLPVAEFDALADGFCALARRYRVQIVGGNLTRSPGPLMIDITVVGSVKRRQALTRAGARPGDELYVTGTIGAATVGLRLLRELTKEGSGFPTHDSRLTTHDSRLTTHDSGLTNHDQRLIQRYLFPEPRVRLGTLLARNRAAMACMDLSDGLADAVRQVAAASGVGAVIEAGALPVEPRARQWLARRGLDPIIEAVTGGDDYELLVAVRPRLRRRLDAARRHQEVPLTRVGVCTEDRALTIRSAERNDPLPSGYGHFR